MFCKHAVADLNRRPNMSLYYEGDLDKDLENLQGQPHLASLETIGKEIGYGRAQQILQILWAKHLRDIGMRTNGALFR